MLKYKLILLCLLFSTMVVGQKVKPVIEVTIDPKTKLPDKLCPFDEFFILNIPINSMYTNDDIRAVHICPTKKQKKADIPVNDIKTNSQKKIKAFQYESIMKEGRVIGYKSLPVVEDEAQYYQPVDTISMEIKDGYKNLKVMVPPLRFGKKYIIIIQYKPSKDWFDGLSKVNQQFFNGGISDNDINTGYHKLLTDRIAINDDYYKVLSIEKRDTVSFSDYKNFFNTNLKAKYTSLHKTVTEEKAVDIKGWYTLLFNNITACKLCTALAECNCHNQSVGEEITDSFASFLQANCCSKEFFDDQKLKLISENKATIADYLKPNPESALEKKQDEHSYFTNLNTSITFLTNLRKLYTGTTLVKYMSCACRDSLVNDVDYLLKLLTAKADVAKKTNDEINKAIDQLIRIGINNGHFSFFRLFNVSADAVDITTAAGNFIIPDVGIALMVPFGTKDQTPIIRPYYGVNISFRPINKNQRFGDIPNKTIGHFLSASVGVTIWSINKRHSDIGDFISGASVLTGLNVRFTRAFRFGAGVAHYYRSNDNPLLQSKYAVMPYFSISGDLDVVNLASKLTDRIFK